MDTVKSALDKVKEAEIKSDRIIEEAKVKARGILKDAKAEREYLLEQARERAKIDGNRLKVKIAEEIAAESAAIKKESKNEIELLKKRAGANVEKATDFIRDKIKA